MDSYEQHLIDKIAADRIDERKLEEQLGRARGRIHAREDDLADFREEFAKLRSKSAPAAAARQAVVRRPDKLPPLAERTEAYLEVIRSSPQLQARTGHIFREASKRLGARLTSERVSRDLTAEKGKLFKLIKKGTWSLGPAAPAAPPSTDVPPEGTPQEG